MVNVCPTNQPDTLEIRNVSCGVGKRVGWALPFRLGDNAVKIDMTAIWIIRVLSVLLALTAGGCGNPYVSTFARTEPDSDHFVGEWHIDVDESYVSFEFGPTIQNASLVLHSDGTFEATELPGHAFNTNRMDGFLLEPGEVVSSDDVTGRGTWKVEKKQGWWAVGLQWTTRSDTPVKYGDVIHIRNQSPEYLLHYTVGDPDTGRAIVFRRDKENATD